MKQSKGRVVFTTAELADIRRLVSDVREADRDGQKVLREELRVVGFRIQELMGDRGATGFTVADLDELIRSRKITVLDL